MTDPTLWVLEKFQAVLEELRVTVRRYDLHEYKEGIMSLPGTLKEADGIILAATVEWYGIGGYMQQFLDACWLYGDKEHMGKTYMCPIVMSSVCGEQEARQSLIHAWQLLGGPEAEGICGYIQDDAELELRSEYARIVEKKAENLYRTINQKQPVFPSSNMMVRKSMLPAQETSLTQEETEDLSRYASDKEYVERRKADIEELALLFRDKMNENLGEDGEYIAEWKAAFTGKNLEKAEYAVYIESSRLPLLVKIEKTGIECSYGEGGSENIELKISRKAMEEIIAGRMTFQRAFMSGAMKMKGDFRFLRMLDEWFVFQS